MQNQPQLKLDYTKLRLICIALTLVGVILSGILWFLYQYDVEALQKIHEQNLEIADLLFYLFLGVTLVSSFIVPQILKVSFKNKPTNSIHVYYNQQLLLFAIYPSNFIYGFLISFITPFEYRNLIFFALGFLLCIAFFPKEKSESELHHR